VILEISRNNSISEATLEGSAKDNIASNKCYFPSQMFDRSNPNPNNFPRNGQRGSVELGKRASASAGTSGVKLVSRQNEPTTHITQ